MEKHVGHTLNDLSDRLDSTNLKMVSSFSNADEAASAISTAFQHNQRAIGE
ncbi:RNase A-like domain-containing protein [Mycolicibacterium vaccae]|uniref:RNase A-like domain-containing protein n=1 Tax=Mycolicibacterium vaccae TaxID=1810 RepID=UPI003D08CF00